MKPHDRLLIVGAVAGLVVLAGSLDSSVCLVACRPTVSAEDTTVVAGIVRAVGRERTADGTWQTWIELEKRNLRARIAGHLPFLRRRCTLARFTYVPSARFLPPGTQPDTALPRIVGMPMTIFGHRVAGADCRDAGRLDSVKIRKVAVR